MTFDLVTEVKDETFYCAMCAGNTMFKVGIRTRRSDGKNSQKEPPL